MTQGIDPLKDTPATVVFTVKCYRGVLVNTILLPKGNNIIHLILVKLIEQGLEETYDEDLAKLCTDLGDLWGAQLSFTARLGDFLDTETSTDDSWNKLADCLADICSELEHMAWHIQSVKGPIERVAQRAYQSGDQNLC